MIGNLHATVTITCGHDERVFNIELDKQLLFPGSRQGIQDPKAAERINNFVEKIRKSIYKLTSVAPNILPFERHEDSEIARLLDEITGGYLG